MKHIACKDFGLDCDYEVSAETEEELLKKVAEHAEKVHEMQVTPELAEQAKSLIKEV